VAIFSQKKDEKLGKKDILEHTFPLSLKGVRER
jgi:hypothetical protein